MPAPRPARAGIPGRSLSAKAGGEAGAHGKSNALQQDEDHLQAMKQKVETLQADLSRRQESYIRRERAFNMRIDELEDEVGSLKSGKMSWMLGNNSMESLKDMHQQILHNVEMVQDRSSKILQEQEKDLLRAFRARLFDVQTELEREKGRKDGGDSAWIERTRQTEAELDWAKEMADRLDRVNQGLSRENSRLKSQFKSQEDDRKFLIKQLVAIKKENQALRQERETAEASMFEFQQKAIRASEDMALAMRARPTSSSSAPNLPGLGGGAARHAGVDADARYKEIIKRLKRLLETERRNLRQVRSSYSAELQQRTELENLLRASVEEVRQETGKKVNAVALKRRVPWIKPPQRPGSEPRVDSSRFFSKPTAVASNSTTAAAPSREIITARKRAAKLDLLEGTKADGMETHSATGGSSQGGGRGSRRREANDDSADSVASFSVRHRQQTLEMLLSRERVLSLLYTKTFPLSPQPPHHPGGDLDTPGGAAIVGGVTSQGGGGGGEIGA